METPVKCYYTYAYLREDKTPYYIGKGKENRIYCKNRTYKPPEDKSRIIFLKQNLTEEEAFKHEKYMIAVFGRKDNGTGILRNMTDGGDGVSNRRTPKQRSESARKGQASRTQEQRKEIAKKREANKTPEQRKEIAKKREANKTPEQRSEAGRKAGSIKFQCNVTGFIANAGNLSKYQRARGIDTSNRVRVS